MKWSGSAEEWQAYCRKIYKLWMPGGLRSIYLQKLDWEFEVEDEMVEGKVGRLWITEGKVELSGVDEKT